MSKKKPAQKVSKKQKPGPVHSAHIPPKKTAKPANELIRLDKKSWYFIITCLFLYFLFVSLKWHNSSIPFWNQLFLDGGDPQRGLLFGTPRGIRSDEWLVTSSFLLAQEKNNYPAANESLGYGHVPLAFGLPAHHILSYVKPVLWGYFLFDVERAYAWQWNFKIFPFLIVTFLLLMLLSQNHFLLSVFGSIWLLLSSAIQWWSINTEVFTYGSLMLISFIYLLFADDRKLIALNGIIFTVAAYSYAMVLYPAYQVPLAYCLLALLIGYVLKNRNNEKMKLTNQLQWKIMTFSAAMFVLISLLLLFYHDAGDTIKAISNTVYPGKRNELGGSFPFARLFTDNFSPFLYEKKFPIAWGNICELSGYLMLAPFASLVIIADWIKSKKTNALLLSIVVFQFFIIIWIVIGFPAILAKLTLMNTSPSTRSFYILGFANCIATVLFIALHKNGIIKKNVIAMVISFILAGIASYTINYFLNKEADSFFTTTQVIITTSVFAVLIWLMLFYHWNKFFRLAFISITLLFLIPNISINPLSYGLGPYLDNDFYKTVQRINASDPNAQWAVFGQFVYANYLKAAGIKCFNGVQFAPPLKKLEILDPTKKYMDIYNRYAHITFASFINGTDSLEFTLRQADSYSINIDPCTPRLHQMGIKYVVFTYTPDPLEIECMTQVAITSGLAIYKRNDS